MPIHLYISDSYQYSNNLFIRIIQKILLNFIKISIIIWALYYLNLGIFNTIFCDSEDDTDTEVEDTTEVEKNKVTTSEDKNKGKDILKVSTSTDDKSEEYYNVSLKKSYVDSATSSISDNSVKIISEVAPQLGIATVSAKVGVELVKQSSRVIPRLGLILGGTAAAATGTALGIEAGKAISRATKSKYSSNTSQSNESPNTSQTIESPDTSQTSTPEVTYNKDLSVITTVEGDNSAYTSNEKSDDDTISPSDGGFINSMLEDSEIPLVILVNSLHIINYLEFSLILGLFSLLFRKYFMKKLHKFILNIIYKKVDNTQDNSLTLNKVFNYIDKYTEYIIFYVFICLIWLKLIHLYISYNLAGDIDNYVALYNSMKHNSLFLLFTIKINDKINYRP